MEQEGWSLNITKRQKTHYYKKGVSLCGRAFVEPFMKTLAKKLEAFIMKIVQFA